MRNIIPIQFISAIQGEWSLYALGDIIQNYGILVSCSAVHPAPGGRRAVNLACRQQYVWYPRQGAYVRTSKHLCLPKYDSPLRYALSSFSGCGARIWLPINRWMPGDGLNIGSRTSKLRAPLFRISNPTMVNECPREHVQQ